MKLEKKNRILYDLRKNLSLTQGEIAEAIGIGETHYNSIENQRITPSKKF